MRLVPATIIVSINLIELLNERYKTTICIFKELMRLFNNELFNLES